MLRSFTVLKTKGEVASNRLFSLEGEDGITVTL